MYQRKITLLSKLTFRNLRHDVSVINSNKQVLDTYVS